MGKIEVRGNAARTVDYDRMKVEINFHSVEMLPTAASEKSMKECEEFLKVLKGDGFDISKIAIKRDSVERDYYSNRDDEQRYRADRTLEIASAFNMNLINDLRDIINNMKYQIGFFDVCVHPDRSFRRKKLWDETCSKIAERIWKTAAEGSIPLEQNESSKRHKNHYRKEFWKFRDCYSEVEIVRGLDAHFLKELKPIITEPQV